MFLTMCHASCLFDAHSCSANSTGSRWCTGGNIVLKGCSMMSTKECSKFWRKLHHLWHSCFKKPNVRKSGVLARTVVPRSCKCHWSSAKVYRLSNAWSQLNMVRILSRQSQGGSLMYRNYSMYQFISPLRWLVGTMICHVWSELPTLGTYENLSRESRLNVGVYHWKAMSTHKDLKAVIRCLTDYGMDKIWQDHEDMTYHYCSCRWRLGFIFRQTWRVTSVRLQVPWIGFKCQTILFHPIEFYRIFSFTQTGLPPVSWWKLGHVTSRHKPASFSRHSFDVSLASQYLKQRTGHVFCAGLKKCRCCLPSWNAVRPWFASGKLMWRAPKFPTNLVPIPGTLVEKAFHSGSRLLRLPHHALRELIKREPNHRKYLREKLPSSMSPS